MRIDMPTCSFTNCRHNQDNNCFAKGGNREGCEYKILNEIAEAIARDSKPFEADKIFIHCDRIRAFVGR